MEIIENGIKTSRPEELDEMIERGRQEVSRGADKRAAVDLSRLLLFRISSLDNPQEVQTCYGEAFDHLDRAVEEERHDRTIRSPFTTPAILFGGTVQFLKTGGQLSADQLRRISELLRDADQRFSDVPGAKTLTSCLRGLLG